MIFRFFFFNDTATSEIYTLSLHDALPIFAARYPDQVAGMVFLDSQPNEAFTGLPDFPSQYSIIRRRSEEHTSELQSLRHLVCRLLLEKKKNNERPTIEASSGKYKRTSNRS